MTLIFFFYLTLVYYLFDLSKKNLAEMSPGTLRGEHFTPTLLSLEFLVPVSGSTVCMILKSHQSRKKTISI